MKTNHKTKHQEGSIYYDRKRKCWFGRYYDSEIRCAQCHKPQQKHTRSDHEFQPMEMRVSKFVKLADKNDQYRVEKDVRPLLDEKLRNINNGTMTANSTATISYFWDSSDFQKYLDELKPSTKNGYVNLWKRHLKPRIGNWILREVQTKDIHNLLERETSYSKNYLKHWKFLIATVFAAAKSKGWLRGVSFDGAINPVQGAKIPRSAKSPVKLKPTSLEHVLNIIYSLEDHPKAQAAIALCYFAGLRPGEARGARWEYIEVVPVFDDNRQEVVGEEWQLRPMTSVWRTHEHAPKTVDSTNPVPIIEPLKSILQKLRELEGNPQSGYILSAYTTKEKSLSLDYLARQIKPLLAAKGIEWKGGYYPQRHGLATKIKATTGNTLDATGALRHSDTTTTDRNYIHPVPDNVRKAMRRVEQDALDLMDRRKAQSGSMCGKSVATEADASEDAA